MSASNPANDQTAGKQYQGAKTEDDWREQLTDEEYYVLRESGTERAFTGEYVNPAAVEIPAPAPMTIPAVE